VLIAVFVEGFAFAGPLSFFHPKTRPTHQIRVGYNDGSYSCFTPWQPRQCRSNGKVHPRVEEAVQEVLL